MAADAVTYFWAQQNAANAAQMQVEAVARWRAQQERSRENNKDIIDAEYTEITEVPMLDLKPNDEDKE